MIKKAKKCEELWDIWQEWKIFTFKEMHIGEKIKEKIVAFLSSVVYYFGDLLKSANMAFVRNKTSISL